MKTLLIMRHGKSSWKDSNLADHERPLKKRGRKDTERIAELLKDKKLVPGVILCSTALRARQTAEAFVDEVDFEGEIEYLDTFYMAEPEAFFERLQTLQDVERVMIIGHNPGLESLLQILADEIKALPTAAVAQLSLDISSWQDLNLNTRGKIKHLWLPREIG